MSRKAIYLIGAVKNVIRPVNTKAVCRLSTMSVTENSPTIFQSQNDKRQYRYIVLKNDLRALLISDLDDGDQSDMEQERDLSESDNSCSDSDGSHSGEDDDIMMDQGISDDGAEDEKSEKKSAAALCVGVGSFSDPEEIPGFAHFLEHMVFMGSEKYPEENNFDDYLGQHGGESNAWTDTERTCFHFDVDRDHFRKALDKFAQFFVSPLLLKDSVDREIQAVDSEFLDHIPSDEDRINQIFSSQAKEGNPMAKFLFGNMDTLKTIPAAKGIDVYGRLRDFFNKYYTAQYMTLVVHSKHSLDTLENWVTESFSDIHNNGEQQLTFKDYKNPFEVSKFNRIYKVIPVEKTHKVYITWAFEPLQEYYRVQPLEYISTMLTHEGEGSLLSYLRKRTWAVELIGGNTGDGFDANTIWSGFNVSITLTDEGFQNVYKVIQTVFEYISLMRREGPLEWFYMENKDIEDIRFRYKEKGEPFDYVLKICENMQIYPPEHFLTGHKLWFQFDHNLLSECIDQLRSDNCNIMITSNHYTEQECTLKEPWFGAMYSIEDISPELMTSWANVKTNASLHLPNPNNFIPTDLSQKEVPDKDINFVPQCISKSEKHKLFYKKDTKFNIPKGFVYVGIQSPALCESLKGSTLLDLFLKILNHNISEPTYPAILAGYEILCATNVNEDRLIFEVDGFNHKLLEVLNLVVDLAVNLECSDELFAAMKSLLKKTYYNNMITPYSTTKYLRFSVIDRRYWSVIDKYRMVDSLTKADLQQFCSKFLQEGFVQSLVLGNFTSEEAMKMMDDILEKLGIQKTSTNGLFENCVLQLPRQKTYCQIQGYNPDDTNSCIVNYYQSTPGTLEKSCLNQVLLRRMKEPCFDRLRTKEQLGYGVWCTNYQTSGVIGLGVTIEYQSNKFSVKYVDDQIESFLLEMRDILTGMSQEEFERLIDTVITQKKVEDTHLEQEAAKHWTEINEGTYLFDRYQKEIMVLKTLTKKSLVDWFTGEYIGENQRKLSIQVVGSDGKTSSDPNHPVVFQIDQQQTGSVPITNLCDFRKSLKHLPHTKIIS